MNNADLIYGTGKYERKPMDFYPTPEDVTTALIDHLEKHLLIWKGSTVWEPACGDGAMSEVLTRAGLAVKSTDLRRTRYAVQHQGGVWITSPRLPYKRTGSSQTRHSTCRKHSSAEVSPNVYRSRCS